MAEMTDEAFKAAKARGNALLAGPCAESAHYDAGRNRVVVRLTTGVEIGFSPRRAQGLEHSVPSDLDEIEISPGGLGIHFPKLDADFYVPGLLKGHLGTKKWMVELAAQDAVHKRPTEKNSTRTTGKRSARAGKSQAA